MKKIIKVLLDIVKILIITFFIILIIDFLFGEKILRTLDPYLKETQFYDNRSRISHNIFHHTFKKNINVKTIGFDKILRLCTNKHGFKSNCKLNENNIFEYGLIGDSFTEGIGLNYEDTFAGIFERNINSNIANLGVSSYSPKIHLTKLNYYLNKGIKFNHIIIFLDISDYYDDAYYILNNNNLIIEHEKKDKLKIKLKKKLPFTNYYFYLIKKFRLKPLLKNIEINKNLIVNKDKIKIFEWLTDDSVVKKTNWLYSDITQYKINNKKFLQIHEDMQFNLNSIYEMLKNRNIKFSLAIYPWPHNLQDTENSLFYKKEWNKFCETRCEYFFDYFLEFENLLKDNSAIEVYKKYYFEKDVHFNQRGNKLIADKLIKILAD